MEAPLVEQQQQLKGPLSAEQSFSEQAPNTEPSILLQQRDDGCPIELQEHHKDSSLEEKLTDNHHSKHSPTQNHHKGSSIEHIPQSEHHHYKPSDKPSEKDISSPDYYSKPSHSKEPLNEASPENTLIESPSEHHHTKPSPMQELQKETSTEKTVVETALEQHHTKPSVVQEHHMAKNLMDTPSEQRHNKPSFMQEHHQEPLLENKMDALTQQQHVKPSLTHDCPKEHSNLAEHQHDKSLPDVHKIGTLVESFQVELSDQKDHSAEHHHHHLLTEQSSVDMSMKGQPLDLVTKPPQSAFPAFLAQHQELHGKSMQEKTLPSVDLSQLQQHINPIFEQNQVSPTNEQNQSTQPLENQPLDSSIEENLNVSSQRLKDVPTEHPLKPLVGQHQAEPPRKETYSEPPVKEHIIEPSIEHTKANKHTTQQLKTTTPADVHGKLKEEAITNETHNSTSRSHKPARAEIDTAAPFESVKAAVSLFGERMDWKSQVRTHPQVQVVSSTERHMLSELELHKAQEDLVHYKEKLALTQASTAGVLLELEKKKKLLQNPVSMQGSTDSLSYKSTEAVDVSKNIGAIFMDKPGNLELQAVLREVEGIKEELISAIGSKEAAGKGLQGALASLDTVSKRVDELIVEKAYLDEALTGAHIALADAEEQVTLLKSGRTADFVKSMPFDFLEKKSAEIKGLELKLDETMGMIAKVNQELLASKDLESIAATAVVEVEQKMAKAKLELEQAKSDEVTMAGQLARILEESDKLQVKLEKARQERGTLSSTVESLKADVKRGRMELDDMHKEEQIACTKLASLQEELRGVKEALLSARAGEAKALEAKDTLPASIKHTASEADEAKAIAESSKEEAHKARQEIEQAKAATSMAVSRQQAALKESEAVRASETMALANLKALIESELHGAVAQSDLEGVMGVTISLEEYSALKRAAVEAEGLADKKVAEAIVRVEEAKTDQIRAQSKLENTLKEAEKGREELQKAQKQADDAQEAKLSAEADFRKWRADHNQRRKSGGAPLDLKAGFTHNTPGKLSSDERFVKPVYLEKEEIKPPLAQGKNVAGMDSLAQVMTLEIPTPHRHPLDDSDRYQEKVKKKRNFIKQIASTVVWNKKT